MKIAILALDGLFDTGLTVSLDTLSIANNFSSRMTGSRPFEVSVTGVKRKIRTAQGLSISTCPVGDCGTPDWVIVPALATSAPDALVAALGRKDVCKAGEQLREWHAQGASIAASCIGSFILAETGLLDEGEATTTWWLAPLFRQRYPAVALDETRMLVPSGRLVTTGAAMGHLDLALWLVRRVSPDLAAVVSRYLLADIRSSQAPYIIPNHLAQADPLIAQFEKWARDHLKGGFSLQDAARALATSTRTLQRRCEAVLGKSPLSYFQDLRVERARALIQGNELDIESVAAEVGYADGATLRTLLRQRLGRGVRELRGDLQ
ncbi:helix-turn-helix domain-containing protein [Bacillus sp. NP157]|nr:helix-turn-helix domain-containing protein [Bacillus sp. NP157]